MSWNSVAHKVCVGALCLATLSAGAANPLPASRTPGGRGTWNGLVGVPGGIPANRTVFTTISAGASLSTVQNAVNNCPSNQIVVLSPGTYNWTGNGALSIVRNGVTVRGAGPGQTIVNVDEIDLGTWTSWQNETQSPSSGNHVSWTGGLAQGSTVITVASTSGYSAGQIVYLDQANDADTSAAGTSGAGTYAGGEYTSVANPGDGHDRIQFQANRIASISGNQITLTEPVYMPNYNSGNSPQIWRFASQPTCFSGVESMSINGLVRAHVTFACWCTNLSIYVSDANMLHTGYLFWLWSVRGQIQHCSLLGPTGGIDNYGIQTRASSGMLVENNSGNYIGSVLEPNGCSGSVWAYNTMTNNISGSSFMTQGLLQHGGFPNMNLYEGNWAPTLGADNTWGGSAYIVALRNRFAGVDQNRVVSGNIEAVAISATNRHFTVVGNVLGTLGLGANYQDDAANGCHNYRIYYLGCWNPGSGCSGPYDPSVLSTLIRAYNWTAATATNGGIVLDGFTAADVPASYYLTSKPAWFGSLPFPAVDPSNPTYASSFTNIPSGYRAMLGVDPPSGPVNQAPVAVITASTNSAFVGQTVNFFSTGSFDPEGVSLSYSWNFGDGSTSTSANPAHIYLSTGTNTVQLTVSDGVNATTASLVLPVRQVGVNLPPVAVAAASVTAGLSPLTVNFSSAGSFDPEGATLRYAWNFGDGGSSTSANPSHAYLTSGRYSAVLTVSDGTNSSSASAILITPGNGASGLVAAYGFEDGAGATLTDASGKGNSGAISGATWVTGKFGQALSFNGTSSLVTINDAASLDFTGGITIEAWVYPTQSSTGWGDIVWKDTDVYFLMGTTPQGPPTLGGLNIANVYATAALPLRSWTHVAGVYDGATMRFYVNGVQVATHAQTGSLATSTGAVFIGGNSINGEYFSGLIDEVRIYNRALSAAELQTDMNSPVVGAASTPTPPQGLRILSP